MHVARSKQPYATFPMCHVPYFRILYGFMRTGWLKCWPGCERTIVIDDSNNCSDGIPLLQTLRRLWCLSSCILRSFIIGVVTWICVNRQSVCRCLYAIYSGPCAQIFSSFHFMAGCYGTRIYYVSLHYNSSKLKTFASPQVHYVSVAVHLNRSRLWWTNIEIYLSVFDKNKCCYL